MSSIRPASLSLGFRKPNRKGSRLCHASAANAGNGELKSDGQMNRIHKEIELPGGGFWWLGARNDEAVLYGDSWTIRRPRIGGQGLVPASKTSKAIQKSSIPSRNNNYPALRPNLPTGLVASGIVILDTDFEVLSDDVPESDVSGSSSVCTGIVHVATTSETGDEHTISQTSQHSSTTHPRRTAKIQFTCNLCGMRNEKFVNPHAWARGSVFAKCDECTVVHKLRDNLKVCLFLCISFVPW